MLQVNLGIIDNIINVQYSKRRFILRFVKDNI